MKRKCSIRRGNKALQYPETFEARETSIQFLGGEVCVIATPSRMIEPHSVHTVSPDGE